MKRFFFDDQLLPELRDRIGEVFKYGYPNQTDRIYLSKVLTKSQITNLQPNSMMMNNVPGSAVLNLILT